MAFKKNDIEHTKMKFALATGGSGGHFFPALKVAQELQRKGHEVRFVGSFAALGRIVSRQPFPVEDVGSKGVPFTISKNWFGSVWAMAKAFGRSLKALKKYRPDAVIGFGGYGAFPVVLSAVMLRIPAMIHEQNVIPGRANALLAKIVKRITVSFKESAGHFDPKKVVVTGCPCHLPPGNADRNTLLAAFGLESGRTTILVCGGSQGSSRLNDVFFEAAKLLSRSDKIQVVHMAGKASVRSLKDGYDKLGIPFALFEFFDKMEEAYLVADLVVSRAGAVTVSEIANFGLPAILVPYPHAKDHQKANADVLCKANLGRLIEEEDLTAENLAQNIRHIFKVNKEILSRARSQAVRDVCYPRAATTIAQEAVQLI